MSARSRTRARWSLARRRFLAAAVASLVLVPYPVAADERDELDKTHRRLGAVESVLADARAEAGAVADALAAADLAVAVARGRLAAASRELEAAGAVGRRHWLAWRRPPTRSAGRRPSWPGRSAAPT